MHKPSTLPVVVFGDQRSAQLAHFLFRHDSALEVIAFCVDAAYRRDTQFCGLPLVDFESLPACYPPERVQLSIPMGYQRINGVRRARFEQARAWGYGFASYISSRASTWPGLAVGENCIIHEHAVIQPFAALGDNVIVRSGAHVSHHCRIASHAFIGAEAAMAGACEIGEQAFVGVGAVLRDNIRIAERCFIGAGAVVTASTQADGVYVGNPARLQQADPATLT